MISTSNLYTSKQSILVYSVQSWEKLNKFRGNLLLLIKQLPQKIKAEEKDIQQLEQDVESLNKQKENLGIPLTR